MRDEPGCEPDATCAGLTLAAFDAARKWREGNALAKRFTDVYGVKPEGRLSARDDLARGKSDGLFTRAPLRQSAERSIARRHDVHVQLSAWPLRAERGLEKRARNVRGVETRAVRVRRRVHVHAPHLGGGAPAGCPSDAFASVNGRGVGNPVWRFVDTAQVMCGACSCLRHAGSVDGS